MKRLGRAALALVLLGAGCESGGGDGAQAPPAPRHPAMGGGATVAGAPAGRQEMPPGHPAVGSGTAAPGASSAPDAPAPAAGRQVQVGPVSLTAPEGWVPQPAASGFVIAAFSLPPAEGDPEGGRVTVSTAGGTTEANVTRWQSQFKENPPAKTENVAPAGLKGVTVRIAGTLSSSGPMAPPGPERPNYRLWGAVIDLPEAGQKLFLKATGPAKTMERWDRSFAEFLGSLKVAG